MPSLDPLTRIILVGIAALIAVTTHLIYVRDVFRGATKPHLFSWLIWALLGGIALAGQLSDGGGAGSWVTAVMCAVCSIISVLAYRYGERSITKLDTGCLVFGLAAIPLWLATETPLHSVILVSFIDAVAFVPTFRKSIHRPHEETARTYIGNTVKWLLAILALENRTPTTVLYPASLFFTNAALVGLLLVRRCALDTRFRNSQ